MRYVCVCCGFSCCLPRVPLIIQLLWVLAANYSQLLLLWKIGTVNPGEDRRGGLETNILISRSDQLYNSSWAPANPARLQLRPNPYSAPPLSCPASLPSSESPLQVIFTGIPISGHTSEEAKLRVCKAPEFGKTSYDLFLLPYIMLWSHKNLWSPLALIYNLVFLYALFPLMGIP